MLRRPIKELNAEFLAEEKYLDGILRTTRESCVTAGLSAKETSAVQLAVEEGASNIIRHAYLYEKGVLRLRIVIYRKLVVFSLIDFGRSFRPDSSGRLDLEQLVDSGRKGGLGFYMIQKIMDSVEYISAAGYNELRMIKRLQPPSGDGLPLLRRMSSLRVRFSLWTFVIVSAIIATSIYYMDHRTTRQLYRHLDQTVASLSTTIADQARGYLRNSRSHVEFDELIVSYLRANSELRLIVLTDSLGLILAHSEDTRYIRKPFRRPDFVPDAQPKHPTRFEYKDEYLNYLVTPFGREGQENLGRVHVIYSSAQLLEQVSESRRNMVAIIVVLLMVGVLGIYLLSNYFVRPIAKITSRVRRFTSGDLTSELPLEGAEEFFEISRAFNGMITRLSQDRQNIIAREKMAKEIEVASQIQKTLMPDELPKIPGLQLDAFYHAASVVGGDLYDVFEIDSGRFCLTVADVSGKGVPASLVMSMLRTVIQIQAVGGVSAKEVLLKVNDYLKSNIPPGMFITVLLIIYDVAHRTLRLVSAGHNPMLFFRSGTGKMRNINPAGMPLGIPVTSGESFEDRLEETTVRLKHNDHFIIFTDGLTEAVGRDGSRFGLQRLSDMLEKRLANSSKGSVGKLRSAIIDAVEDFSGFAAQNDDLTFIVARSFDKSEAKSVRKAASDDSGKVAVRKIAASSSRRRSRK